MESPSGREWDDSTNRLPARTASTIRCSSGAIVLIVAIGGRGGIGRLVGAKLVEDLLDAILAGHRVVVEESELGRPSQAQARPDLTPEKRRGPVERLGARGARFLIAEHRVV